MSNEFVKASIQYPLTPGEALRALRELQGLTQGALADASGIAQPHISAMERGEKNIGRERALMLAKALRVHPAVILFPDFDLQQVA